MIEVLKVIAACFYLMGSCPDALHEATGVKLCDRAAVYEPCYRSGGPVEIKKPASRLMGNERAMATPSSHNNGALERN